MALRNIVSYSLADSRRYFMGLVGLGPALDALTRLVGNQEFSKAFPRTKIVGWVPTPGAAPEKTLAVPRMLRNQPLLTDISSLFALRPGIQLVIDLSPDSRHMRAMRAAAPDTVSLCASDALLSFCAAAEDGRLALSGGGNLRRAEKLFALLVDQMDGDILILDGRGVILDVNRHAMEMRGLTRNEIIGRGCTELDSDLRFCSGDEDRCPFHTARDTHAQAEHTFVQVLPSGRVRYMHAVCFPITDAMGMTLQYLYIRRDVTEKHSLEQRMQQTEKMAAIGELSTYMAHEIRNPLFSIGGFANALLRNSSLSDLAREKARIIYEESRRLDQILTSILNFARPTEQTMGVFEPDVVARRTIDLMTIGSEERGINAITEIEDKLPKAHGNAENLQQCLINIVKNALEAMPDGGTLTLQVKRNNGFVQIDVEDTGKGIPPAIQEQVFSPFFSTKQGAGLGLAMTRKIIEEMGGKALLESWPGRGTRVSLLVPAALAVDEDAQEHEDKNPPAGEEPAEGAAEASAGDDCATLSAAAAVATGMAAPPRKR